MSRKNNLGDALEEMLNWSCRQYLQMGVANIAKVPTPFKIIKRDFKTHFLLAVPEEKSGVDYLGEYGGQPFAMEAKKTENKTSYPMDPWDREKHQREFLKRWNGLRYYLISFWSLGEHYLMPYTEYIVWHEQSLTGGRKSIPIDFFRKRLPRVKEGGRVALDFLDAADRMKNYF